MTLSYSCTTVRVSIAFLGKVEDLEAEHWVEFEVISFDGSRQGAPTECSCIHMEVRGDAKDVEESIECALALEIDGERPFSRQCSKSEHSEPHPEFVTKLNTWIRDSRV